jgi:hypothetical protein
VEIEEEEIDHVSEPDKRVEERVNSPTPYRFGNRNEEIVTPSVKERESYDELNCTPEQQQPEAQLIEHTEVSEGIEPKDRYWLRSNRSTREQAESQLLNDADGPSNIESAQVEPSTPVTAEIGTDPTEESSGGFPGRYNLRPLPGRRNV